MFLQHVVQTYLQQQNITILQEKEFVNDFPNVGLLDKKQIIEV